MPSPRACLIKLSESPPLTSCLLPLKVPLVTGAHQRVSDQGSWNQAACTTSWPGCISVPPPHWCVSPSHVKVPMVWAYCSHSSGSASTSHGITHSTQTEILTHSTRISHIRNPVRRRSIHPDVSHSKSCPPTFHPPGYLTSGACRRMGEEDDSTSPGRHVWILR